MSYYYKDIDINTKKEVFFQLIAYNWIVDHRADFPTGAYVVLLYIFRQTIGFQKDIDPIRYNLMARRTKLTKPTLTKHVNWLVDNGYVVRLDCDLEVLTKVYLGYRRKIYYGLSIKFLNILLKHYSKYLNGTV